MAYRLVCTNAGTFLIGPLGINFSEILIKIWTFSFNKMHLKMLSGKWRPFCLGLNELKVQCQAIYADTSSPVAFCGLHLRSIAQGMLKLSICNMSLKNIHVLSKLLQNPQVSMSQHTQGHVKDGKVTYHMFFCFALFCFFSIHKTHLSSSFQCHLVTVHLCDYFGPLGFLILNQGPYFGSHTHLNWLSRLQKQQESFFLRDSIFA